MKKKLLSLFLAVTLILSNLGMYGFAGEIPTYHDLPDDWSKVGLENAVKNGLLQGHNGKISPKNFVTRAELAAIVVNAMGAEKKASIAHLSDVDPNAWYADATEKALLLNVFRVTENKFEPNAYITREEVFYVIANLLKSQNADPSILSRFSDADQLSDWSKDAVSVLVEQGIITGNDKMALLPQSTITRAELAAVLDKFASAYIREDGTYSGLHEGSVVVTAKDVILSDMTITGNLIIADGVGDGDVSLENVTVEGELIVRGGGENSIRIFGISNVKKVVIAKVDGIVRVLTEDGVVLNSVYLDGKDDVILEGNFGDIEIQSPDVKVLFYNAMANNITVGVPDVNLDVKNAQINAISVAENATNAIVSLSIAEVGNIDLSAQNISLSADKQTKVKEIVVEGDDAKVTGEGKVEKVLINANDANIDTKGTLVSVSKDVTGTKAGGTEVAPGSSTSTPAVNPVSQTPSPTNPTPSPTDPTPSPSEPSPVQPTEPVTGGSYTISGHSEINTARTGSIRFAVNNNIEENILHPEKVAVRTSQAIYHLTGTYEKTLDNRIVEGTYRIYYNTNPNYPYTSMTIYLTTADKEAIEVLEGKDLYDASRQITDTPTNKLILDTGWTTNAPKLEAPTYSLVPYAFEITGVDGFTYKNPLINMYSPISSTGYSHWATFNNNYVINASIIQQATFASLSIIHSADTPNSTNDIPTRMYYQNVPTNALSLGKMTFDLGNTPYINITDNNWGNYGLTVKNLEIVGTLNVGNTLTLLGDGQILLHGVKYHWYADDVLVSNDSTYTLQENDVNKVIRVMIYAQYPTPYNFFDVNAERSDW